MMGAKVVVTGEAMGKATCEPQEPIVPSAAPARFAILYRAETKIEGPQMPRDARPARLAADQEVRRRDVYRL